MGKEEKDEENMGQDKPENKIKDLDVRPKPTKLL